MELYFSHNIRADLSSHQDIQCAYPSYTSCATLYLYGTSLLYVCKYNHKSLNISKAFKKKAQSIRVCEKIVFQW